MLTVNDPLDKATSNKRKNVAIADILAFAGNTKYQEKLMECGTWLHFDSCPSGHEKYLRKANFCKKRLCPFCQWRRTVRLGQELLEVLHAHQKENPKDRHLMITLTTHNCVSEDLGKTITDLHKGWDRLVKYKEVSKVLKGYFRSLEVTYNASKDTYNPHIHILCVVPPGYFTKDYIKRDRWLSLWKKAMNNPSITQVDIRTIKPKKGHEKPEQMLRGGVAEVSKYAVKTSDFLSKKLTQEKQAEVLLTYAFALHKRKLQTFAGCLLDWRKKLQLERKNQDLEEMTDLLKLETCRCSICNSELVYEIYRWQRDNYSLHGVNETSWIKQALKTAETAQKAKKLFNCLSVSEGEKVVA